MAPMQVMAVEETEMLAGAQQVIPEIAEEALAPAQAKELPAQARAVRVLEAQDPVRIL